MPSIIPTPRAVLRRPDRLSISARRRLDFYLAISPWLVGMVFFTGGPMLASLVVSFTDWDILTPPTWVGLGNYRQMLATDTHFPVALFNTAFYAFFTVCLETIAALLLAVLLNQRLAGVRWFRTIIYLPSVTSGVVLAVVWLWIYSPQFGIFQYVLELAGVRMQPWILDTFWAKVALIVTNLWQIGPSMVIFLAGLQGIPSELYEAAAIDGAGGWARFRRVTLPLLSPVTFFVITIAVISSFQVFTSALIITQGGPGTGTLFYTLYLYYKAFQDLQMGYAAGLAWVLFLIVVLLTAAQFRFARSWVYYETGAAEGRQ